MYGVTSTGNIKTWACDVIANSDDTATLSISTQTKLDGKVVEREEIITEGKNLGKSNETTPYEQAVSEAESRYRKKIKKGYKTEIPTDLTKADTNALGMPKPMLAHPLKVVKKVEFPAYFQPKLDGHRALVTKKDGKMVMYSRGGDWITTMSHILDYLDPFVEEGQFLDGELYLHGELLQNIGSYVRKYRPGVSETVLFYVYDTMMDEPYTQRVEKLRIMLPDDAEAPAKLLTTLSVDSMELAMTLRDRVIEQGYEGGILRTPDEGYQAGKKSRTLLKLKTFDDNEFKIIDVVEGKDRIVNDVHLKVACFICEISPGGPTFEVTSMGDMYDKDKTWHNRKDFINKMLTVKHSGYTKDKIPWHPVALRLREDI